MVAGGREDQLQLQDELQRLMLDEVQEGPEVSEGQGNRKDAESAFALLFLQSKECFPLLMSNKPIWLHLLTPLNKDRTRILRFYNRLLRPKVQICVANFYVIIL